MSDSVETLIEMLIDDVPLRFVKAVIERTPLVYKEAYSRSYEEPAWDEPEAQYIIGHNRRVVFEKMYRTEAINAGLAVDVQSNGRNCSYTLVRSGRFILTASHVQNQSEVTKPALFREQFAGINKLLTNPLLPFLELDPLQLSRADNVYAIVLHGCESRNPQNVGFMRLAFPSADSEAYVANLCLFELQQKMALRKRAIPQEEKIVDLARPRLKKKKQNE